MQFDEAIAPARGISEGGKISLLPGMSPAETFATLSHELAHELLHRQIEQQPRNATPDSFGRAWRT